ncbi:MAG: outer membrane beta-barrel protein [Magnetococcales bacterium]|nr:outer membrane beta-barrel protein [Magnetococcales bacterium]
MNCRILSLLTLAVLATPVTTHAQGGYLGVGAGWAHYPEDNDVQEALDAVRSYAVSNLGTTVRSSSTSTDYDKLGYKIFLGYDFNEWIALEVGYLNLNGSDLKLNSSFNNGTAGDLNFDSRVHGASLTPVFKYHPNKQSTIFGKVGGFLYNVKTEAKSSGALAAVSGSEKSDGVSLITGVGGEFKITNNLSLRAEYEFLNDVGKENKTGQTDIHFLSGSIVIHQ